MTTAPRRVAHDLMPPILGRALARRSQHAHRFVDDYPTWESASAAAAGYSQSAILAQVEQATEDVISGRAAFERDGVAFDEIEYRWPVAAALLWQAARDGGRLNVLDFGGSLGSTYRQYTPLIEGLNVRWGVVEQANYVAAGRRFANEQLSFHDTIGACTTEVHPRVGLLSSVLQYLASPYEVLDAIALSEVEVIIIDRTPMTELDRDVPAVQVVPPSIYTASYPAWLFSRERLATHLPLWKVIDTFPGIEPDLRTSGGTPVSWLGMILRRR